MDTCEHGIHLMEDWCSRCNGAPGSYNPPSPKRQTARPRTFKTLIRRMDDAKLRALWNLRNTITNPHDYKLVRDAIVERISELRFMGCTKGFKLIS